MLFTLRYLHISKSVRHVAENLQLLLILLPSGHEAVLSNPYILEILLHPLTTQLAIGYVTLLDMDGQHLYFCLNHNEICSAIGLMNTLTNESGCATFAARIEMLPVAQRSGFVKAWISRADLIARKRAENDEISITAIPAFFTFVQITTRLCAANATLGMLFVKYDYFRECALNFGKLAALAHAAKLPIPGTAAKETDFVVATVEALQKHLNETCRPVEALVQALSGGFIRTTVTYIAGSHMRLPGSNEIIHNGAFTLSKLLQQIIPMLTSKKVLEALASGAYPWPNTEEGRAAREAQLPIVQQFSSRFDYLYRWAVRRMLAESQQKQDLEVRQCNNMKVRAHFDSPVCVL